MRRREAPAVLLLCLYLGTGATVLADGERDDALCFYVASYHVGYSWSDSVERELRAGLESRCDIAPFYLDTKRSRSIVEMTAAARGAYERMRLLDADIVITSDDNAARHFIEPWLLGTEMPVVFSGISWSIEEYGLPAPNVTGMVEVAPLRPVLEMGRKMSRGGTRAAFVGLATIGSRKELERARRIAAELALTVDGLLVDSVADWRTAYVAAQGYDFVVIGDGSDIGGWNAPRMRAFVHGTARVPVLTTAETMTPYAAVGLTRVPEEQGQWAAATARAVLDGTSPAEIPIVTNRKWDAWVNEPLLERSGAELEPGFLRRAKRVR